MACRTVIVLLVVGCGPTFTNAFTPQPPQKLKKPLKLQGRAFAPRTNEKKRILAATLGALAVASDVIEAPAVTNQVLLKTQSKKGKVLVAQEHGALSSLSTLALAMWAIAQTLAEKGSTVGIFGEVGPVVQTMMQGFMLGYLYNDFFLWLQHCFLDQKENLVHPIPFVRYFAKTFQDHHDNPAYVMKFNYLQTIDGLVSATAGMGLALSLVLGTPAVFKWFTVWTIVTGSLGALNHLYCHALTRADKWRRDGKVAEGEALRNEVPQIIQFSQSCGLLPSAKHHSDHHTAPFDKNWNFITGPNKIYEILYYSVPEEKRLPVLTLLIWLFNPVSFQALLRLAGLAAGKI